MSNMRERLSDPEYRKAFVASQINIGIPFQIRALLKSRPGWTQETLANRTGMLQPRISGLMTPGKTRPNIETLRRIAEAFDCGLMVRFVPFSELAKWSDHFDPENFDIPSFDEDPGFEERKSVQSAVPVNPVEGISLGELGRGNLMDGMLAAFSEAYDSGVNSPGNYPTGGMTLRELDRWVTELYPQPSADTNTDNVVDIETYRNKPKPIANEETLENAYNLPNENELNDESGIGHEQRSAQFGTADYSHAQRGRLYANHVAASMTLFDIRLLLSCIHVSDDGKIVADEAVEVLMSPELAQLVMQILGRTVEAYQSKYGNLRWNQPAAEVEENKLQQ